MAKASTRAKAQPSGNKSRNKIELFDTTLRDGNQAQGVDFSYADKLFLAAELDALGVDYIEGGWPGANPIDTRLFDSPPALSNAKWVAFGMTRHSKSSADNDHGLNLLKQAKSQAICMVCKTSDFQVATALNTTLDENLRMISSSLEFLGRDKKHQLFVDAEHFFDGYKRNPKFALACLDAAHKAGAERLVLCDTNGGTLPDEIAEIITTVRQKLPAAKIGIHTHNDSGCAIACAMAGINAGATHVQGTIGGIGERTGNADLLSVIANLSLKTNFKTSVTRTRLKRITRVAQALDARLSRPPNTYLPYVGTSAFAHKGGLHGSAVARDPRTYEHIDPEIVGNKRLMVMSDQGGKAQLLTRLQHLGLPDEALTAKNLSLLVKAIKENSSEGISYDGADASLELMVLERLHLWKPPFQIKRFRAIDERRINLHGDVITESEATLIISVENKELHQVAFGDGPVNALDVALRKILIAAFPKLESCHLADFKVRIIPPQAGAIGTDAVTRVTIDFVGGEKNWTTVGVSGNIIAASLTALCEGYMYALLGIQRKNKGHKWNLVSSKK